MLCKWEVHIFKEISYLKFSTQSNARLHPQPSGLLGANARIIDFVGKHQKDGFKQ